MIVFLVMIAASIVPLWITMIVQGHMLLWEFKTLMPTVARQVLPEAFSAMRHPKKFWYFLTPDAKKLLAADPRLDRRRLRVVVLTISSIVYPFVVIGVISIVAHVFSY
jgi:hypothetical protein